MAQAVIFIEKTEDCFEPITLKSKHKCLLPVVNIPIIDYTISSLKNNKFASVTIICSSHVNEIKAHVGSTWGNQQGFEINVVDGDKSKGSLGDALHKLDKKKFTQPFLVLYGDVISNIDFHEVMTQFSSQQRNTCLMLALLKDLGADLRDGDLEPRRASAVVWENVENQQMHFGDDGRKFWRQEKQSGKHDNLKRGLLAAAAVCSPNILNFSEDFKQCVNLQKIMWALQRDPRKIKQPALAIRSLQQKEYINRVTSIHKYILCSQDVLTGAATDVGRNKLLKEGYNQRENADFRHSNSNVNVSATTYESVAIGAGTEVQRHARIMNAVIGKGCKIGKNVWIEGAIIGDDVVIKDNARVVFSILDKKVTVGDDATVMPWCVLGEKSSVDDSVTKTCFTWDWHGKKLQDSMDVDEEPGPHEIKDWDDQEVDSDDDTELLSLGQEVEIDPETTEIICEMFFDYLMMLFEQCFVDKNMLKRCVKELTEMRRAFKLPVRMMARLVTRGVMQLPMRQNSSLTDQTYMPQANQMINTFKNILEFMIRTRESMRDCQDGIEDAANNYPTVIQPHRNEIIDLLRTANIIHERQPAQPTKEEQERREKERKEREKKESHRRVPGRMGDEDEEMMEPGLPRSLPGSKRRGSDSDD